MKKFVYLIPVLFSLLWSCNYKDIQPVPDDVIAAIDSAKDNGDELIKVINHYRFNPADSLKLKAAYFLIANMPGHSYVKAKLVDTAGNPVAFDVLDYPNYEAMRNARDSLKKKIGEFDWKLDTIIYDLYAIKAGYLIKNIDLAFETWQYPWAKILNFDEFCEYVLPYRGSNEPLEDWRDYFHKKYAWIVDSMKNCKDPSKVASAINNEIKKWFKFDARFYFHPTDQGLSEMLKNKMGRCEDMTNLAIYAMRALGVPVMSDYVPYWANTGNNHAWNATLDSNKNVVIFMGGGDNPGEYKLGNKKAKVYRKTYSHQKDALVNIAPDYEKLPAWLNFDQYIDVTPSYTKVADFDVDLKNEKPDSVNFAYVSVFNDGDWRPIDWGRIDGKKAAFHNVGVDIIYLPVYYNQKSKVVPANYPFILDTAGKVNYVIPDTNNLTELVAYSTTRRSIYKTTDKIDVAYFDDGATYELFYWDGKWIKAGEAKAIGKRPLRFKKVPAGALYWLVKKDGRKEERIFTLDANGNQVWW